MYPESYTSGVIKIPDEYAGKCVAISFRNEDTPTANISSEISALQDSYFHYYRVKYIENELSNTTKSIFKYDYEPIYYTGNRLVVSNGGYEAHSYALGTQSYIGASKDNPVLISCPKGYTYDALFYSGNTQGTYISHSGRLYGDTIFNGEYNGITYNAIRVNIAYNPEVVIEDETALKANFKYYRSTSYLEGSGSGLAIADKRFTVNVNLNWRDDATETANNTDILCILRLPASYSQTGKPTPLIMFCHGGSAQITNDMWYNTSSNFANMVNAFVNAGYAIFDVNNTRNQSDGFPDWGSLPLMTAYIKAWQYIKRHYNVEDKLYLLSDSMGTVANLNMCKWYGADIIASIQTAPRPICSTRYADYTGTLKTNMASAFDLESTTWTGDRLKGFDHYENALTIGDKEYIFEKYPPIKAMVGTADTDYLTETRNFYAALSNGGNYVNYREIAGADHTKMSFLRDATLRAEAVAWFDRFRYQQTN